MLQFKWQLFWKMVKKDVKFYEEGICTLMKCYDKCLNLNDNYFGKW